MRSHCDTLNTERLAFLERKRRQLIAQDHLQKEVDEYPDEQNRDKVHSQAGFGHIRDLQ